MTDEKSPEEKDTKPGWTHEAKVELPASRERVWRALTDPAELTRWFAEGVEVEPMAGGKFRFWGRYTYGAPARAKAHQRITRFDAGREIAFEWEIEGIESEVILVLEPISEEAGAEKTRLLLRHKFPCPPAVAYPTELVEDMWHLILGNLRAYLRFGEEAIVRPDFTDPRPEIRVSIVIEAPRERVFRALLEPAALDSWIASGAQVEPRVGGRYRYGWKYKLGGKDVEGGPTKILELVENERIVTDWPDWRGDESRGSTRVAWILESLGPDRTRVTLVHDGFGRAADIGDYPFGWGGFLRRLKGALEKS
jgi:uncharacterized protein YndB with AHSA1/START domain